EDKATSGALDTFLDDRLVLPIAAVPRQVGNDERIRFAALDHADSSLDAGPSQIERAGDTFVLDRRPGDGGAQLRGLAQAREFLRFERCTFLCLLVGGYAAVDDGAWNGCHCGFPSLLLCLSCLRVWLYSAPCRCHLARLAHWMEQ